MRSSSQPVRNFEDNQIATKEQPKKDESVITIDLKDMNLEDIVRTYPKHEVALTAIFHHHKNLGHDYRYRSHFKQFLTILSELLLERQQVNMYSKLRTEFDPNSNEQITSNVR